MLKILNTLGREKEEFKPLNDKQISFYHCGPTVYWSQHIGNMRAVVMGDLIRRSIETLGYQVKFVRNYTDFGHLTGDNIGDADTGEDRMEKAVKRENITPKEIADKYINQYERDISRLNALKPTITARATDYIEQMINFVSVLLEKGYAYNTPKAVYFDTSKSQNYYELSGHKPEEHIHGAGHGSVTDSNKKHPSDFALWFYRTGDHAKALQYWPSPFSSPEVENGYGFPGWHIECSAMCLATLGPRLDIHMGGVEHVSIHHTNEIAQSEAYTGQKFVNYWLHNEHLNMNGQKIGKSTGNFYLLDDLVDLGYNPMHLRYFFLQAHYRSKQNFTLDALNASKNAYEKLVSFFRAIPHTNNGKVLEEYKTKLIQFLEDDFNIPGALGLLWLLIKDNADKSDIKATILYFDQVLGLNIQNQKPQIEEAKIDYSDSNKSKIDQLIKERERAREAKNWTLADQIRDQLKNEYNFEFTDTSIKR